MDYEFNCEYDPGSHIQDPLKYGVCSTLNSLLEPGKPVQPVLNFPGDKLDLERRGPQRLKLKAAVYGSNLLSIVDGEKRE